MAVKPILHRILVKQDRLEDRDETFKRARAAGIITDFDERKREQAAIDTGTVVTVGPTAFLAFDAPQDTVKPGDTIVYAKYGGKTVKDPEDGAEYVLLNDDDVIAIITEGA